MNFFKPGSFLPLSSHPNRRRYYWSWITMSSNMPVMNGKASSSPGKGEQWENYKFDKFHQSVPERRGSIALLLFSFNIGYFC